MKLGIMLRRKQIRNDAEPPIIALWEKENSRDEDTLIESKDQWDYCDKHYPSGQLSSEKIQ
jgi:hypothetical protein